MRIRELFTAITGAVLAVCAASAGWAAEPCEGLPQEAVTTLPGLLAKWGALVCTPYGQILSNHEGLIWTYPGGYLPVFVPSQLVRDNPEPLGNKSYFTRITWNKVDGDEFRLAYSAFTTGFAPEQKMPDGYRLDVKSISGREMELYFFDYGSSAWGLWCPERKCDSQSRFMILDMSKRP